MLPLAESATRSNSLSTARIAINSARQLHRGVYACTVLSTATDRGQAFKQELVAVQSIAYVNRPREHARLGNRLFSIEDRKN